MSQPDTAANLTALAAWIDEQLGDETADRQWIAESAAARVRDIILGDARRRRASASCGYIGPIRDRCGTCLSSGPSMTRCTSAASRLTIAAWALSATTGCCARRCRWPGSS